MYNVLKFTMQSIGPYRLDSELGRGAMGIVFRGFDPAIGRAVAIKIIQLNQFATANEKAELKLRFAREATAAGKLSHPNIVTVYHLGEQSDLQYLVLELVEGWSLEKALSNGIPQDRRVAISILSQVARALDYAHGEGIVHRDVKPANILVRPDGKAKITDFGIARISSQTVTKTGFSMGTPAYMAPEQIMSARVSGQADQFSLAVIAYQMLSGRRPFIADTDPGLIFKIVSEEARPLHELDRSFPPRTSDVLRKGLAKDPNQRYATCADFIAALSESLDERMAAAPAVLAPIPKARNAAPASANRARAWLPAWVIALPAGALATLALLAFFVVLKRPAQRPVEVAGSPAATPPPVGHAAQGAAPPPALKPAPPPAPVAQFTAEPASIQRGQSSTLRWQVNGHATSISLDQGIGAAQRTGNRGVSPSESTTYTLAAIGPGGTAYASVTVSVTPPTPPADVGSVKTEAPHTQAGLQKTIDDLKSANGDLGVWSGLIATNHTELEALRLRGERNYVDIKLGKTKQAVRFADITLKLVSVTPKKNKYSVDVVADDKLTEKKDRNINEPVQIYTSKGGRIPYELVINQVDKDMIVGYLSTPKVETSR